MKICTGLSRQEGRIYGCRPPALSIKDLNVWWSRLAADEIMICKVIKLWNIALRLKKNITRKFKFAYIGRRTTIINTTFLPKDACKMNSIILITWLWCQSNYFFPHKQQWQSLKLFLSLQWFWFMWGFGVILGTYNQQ